MSTYVVTATGTGNWVVPAGVTSVQVELWGGGGGGGASLPAGSGGSAAAGGGAGAYVIETGLSVTPGNSITYVIAKGGNGGSAGPLGNGGSGGTGYKSGGAGYNGSNAAGGGGGGSSSVNYNSGTKYDQIMSTDRWLDARMEQMGWKPCTEQGVSCNGVPPVVLVPYSPSLCCSMLAPPSDRFH